MSMTSVIAIMKKKKFLLCMAFSPPKNLLTHSINLLDYPQIELRFHCCHTEYVFFCV